MKDVTSGWASRNDKGMTDILQNDIVCRYAIARDEKQVVWRGCRIDVAHFALREQREARKVRVNESRHDRDEQTNCKTESGVQSAFNKRP